MATQVQTATDGVQEKASGAQDKVQGYTSSILSTVDGLFSSISTWMMGLLDRFFPPEQRAAFLAKMQEFMLSNPKLSVSHDLKGYLTGAKFRCYRYLARRELDTLRGLLGLAALRSLNVT